MVRPGVEIVTPRDRAAWLRARGQDVTASAIGALFGEHEFLTVLELWARKTGRLPDSGDETPAMRRGRLLEAVAVQMLREDYPEWELSHNAAENTYFRDPAARLGATPDVIVNAPGRGRGVIQIKSVEQSVFRRKWMAGGPEEPVEPPFWIALQATLEAWLTGAQWAAVAPLVIGHGIELPLIEVDLTHMEGVAAAMTEKAAEFWRMVEEDREPPFDFARDGAVIEALYAAGDAREEVDLTGDAELPGLIGLIHDSRDRIKSHEAAIQEREARIKAAMGRAEIAHIAGGQKITWKTIRKSNPAGLPTVYRQLRLPKL